MKNTKAKNYLENNIVKNNIVNDVTLLNPVEVNKVFMPKNTKEIIDFIKTTTDKVSI
jgi:hypothetical protein